MNKMQEPIVTLQRIRNKGHTEGDFLELSFGRTHVLINVEDTTYLAAIGYKDGNFVGMTTDQPQKRSVRNYINEWFKHYSFRVSYVYKGAEKKDFEELFFVEDERKIV